MTLRTSVKVPKHTLHLERIFTLGADPEFFVYKDEKLVPAFTFLPEKGGNTSLFWDGFQAEFTMPTYPHCIGLHGCDVHRRLRELQIAMVKKLGEEAKIVLNNVVRVPNDMLEEAYDVHVALGCSPSMNAYGMKGTKVTNPRELKYRFAGGHMHFGGFPGNFTHHTKFVKALDKVIGVWGVGAAQKLDNSIRREYYGLAGEYRPTKYPDSRGVEYRTLSNFYFCHPAIHQLTWEIARKAMYMAEDRSIDAWASTDEETIKCINDCDVDLAKRILKRNEPILKWALESSMWSKKEINYALVVGQKGVGEIIGKPDDIARNWKLSNPDLHIYGDFVYNLGYKAYVETL